MPREEQVAEVLNSHAQGHGETFEQVDAANPAGQPLESDSDLGPKSDDEKLRNALVLFERLSTDPDGAAELALRAGSSYAELLPLLHAKALQDRRGSPAYVTFIGCLRRSLPAGQRQEIDQLLFDNVKSSVLRTLEMDPTSRSAVVLRARGVRSMHVLSEALSSGMVGPEQVGEVVGILSADLETHCAPQQDLRVLLLSHVLGAVCPSDGPAAEELRRIVELTRLSGMQEDTQLAFGRVHRMKPLP